MSMSYIHEAERPECDNESYPETMRSLVVQVSRANH